MNLSRATMGAMTESTLPWIRKVPYLPMFVRSRLGTPPSRKFGVLVDADSPHRHVKHSIAPITAASCYPTMKIVSAKATPFPITTGLKVGSGLPSFWNPTARVVCTLWHLFNGKSFSEVLVRSCTSKLKKMRLAHKRHPKSNDPTRQGCPISLQKALFGTTLPASDKAAPHSGRGTRAKRKAPSIPLANNTPAKAATDPPRTTGSRIRIANQSTGPAVPFMGDFSGATWNVQSLHNENGSKRNRKVLRLKQLLQNSDFVMLQETYSTKGFEKGFKPPPGCKMWWSHDPTREAPRPHNTPLVKRKGGIVLVVKDSFLKAVQNIQLGGYGQG